MNAFKKITYYDLRQEAQKNALPALVGRNQELARLDRCVGRRINNNIVLVGPGGIGKTTLMYGWVRNLARLSRFLEPSVIQFDIEHLYALEEDTSEEEYMQALTHVRGGIVCIDDFGREVYKNPALMSRFFRIYKELIFRPDVHLVLSLQSHEHTWLAQEYPSFLAAFETISLKTQPAHEQVRILTKALPRLNAHRLLVPQDRLKEIIAQVEHFPVLGQLPRAGIMLLDEVLSSAHGQGERKVLPSHIATIVEAKTGVPQAEHANARLSKNEIRSIRNLERDLNARIVDQKAAIKKIATTLQRARLGLRNPDRPLGSFLLLGPSGVGKTETAKVVSEMMFGLSPLRQSFIRFDMSEFQQDHTVQRLIGAPSGYVGYEEGGALTNALKREPYSLVLLDEIEKAHPKVFDLFLQLLDDGRLTSGQNETVDARNAIFMATSNTAVTEILDATKRGETIDESYLKERIMPILAKTFRLEFINRFDAVLIFQPLASPALFRIAQLEIKKMEKRFEKHRVQFDIEGSTIAAQIERLADPRFGARPVKRFVEETCETLLMESLLSRPSWI